MLVWLVLCFPLVVIAQEIPPLYLKETSEKQRFGNEEVLFKIWAILSNVLDTDGTTRVLNQNDISYVLTLIKKSVLENTENIENLQKLFLMESELAKYKGVYLDDNRTLKSLLNANLYPNNQNSIVTFKYDLPGKEKPSCKEAFLKLIKKSHQQFADLARSPVCSDRKDWLTPNSNNQIAESLFENTNYNNTFQIDSNFNIPSAYQNTNPQIPQFDVGIQPKIPNLDSLHAVEFTKNDGYLVSTDFTADLDHAKSVADKINKLYETHNVNTSESQSLKEQALDNFIFRNIKKQTQTSPLTNQVMPSYTIQNTNLNNLSNKMGALSQSHTASNNMFVNSNYYSKYSNPYPHFPPSQGILQNNVPGINYVDIITRNNILRNRNPYKNNLDRNSNLIQSIFKPQTSQTAESGYYAYNNNINAVPVHEYGYQPNPATGVVFVQNVPQPVFYRQNRNNPYLNVNTNIDYNSQSHVQGANVAKKFVQQAANYNNGQPVIDKAANWISGINAVELNSNMENDKTEVELTYLVRHPPLVWPTSYFVKFRMPYKEFIAKKSNIQSLNTNLYNELVSRYKASVTKADVPPIQNQANVDGNRLIRAALIESADTYSALGSQRLKLIFEDNPAIRDVNVNVHVPVVPSL